MTKTPFQELALSILFFPFQLLFNYLLALEICLREVFHRLVIQPC
jgi:hypothetical protein